MDNEHVFWFQVAAVFTPYSPHVGSTGALFGLVGLLVVELIQFWKVIKKPHIELLKIVCLLCVFLFTGTLPYVDNFSIITGLGMGMLSACVLLPYVAVSKGHTRCRFSLVVVCMMGIAFSYFVLLYIFYRVQTFEDCKICEYINCIPYSEKMCKKDLDTF